MTNWNKFIKKNRSYIDTAIDGFISRDIRRNDEDRKAFVTSHECLKMWAQAKGIRFDSSNAD
jgi:hypothetical protein